MLLLSRFANAIDSALCARQNKFNAFVSLVLSTFIIRPGWKNELSLLLEMRVKYLYIVVQSIISPVDVYLQLLAGKIKTSNKPSGLFCEVRHLWQCACSLSPM